MEEGVKKLEKEAFNIRWKQPGRIGVALVLLYVFSWYLFNDMFNLISIEGLGVTGNFFNGINIPAAIPFFVSFIVMISILLTFIIKSTVDQSSHKILNTIVGIWIYFGTFLMVISLTLMLQGSAPSYQVPWLLGLTRNAVYHIGVFVFQIPGIVYFALFR
ncbi:MAG: hypothetical protein U1B79_00840 [Candidatus Pacearchaeota archaeon]|nr:hypothetical protein [Nanoarchaeota archaeon]MDZ4226638.1 hypothetical protein [Candidatus Pacearchaeota archaeon]